MDKLELTLEEAQVLEYTIFLRMCKLEDCGLTDSFCYPRLDSIRQKLKQMYNLTENSLQDTKNML